MPYKDPEKERACGRRRYERITAERIARGMCPRCGKARPAPDRTLCRHCGEKRRKAERARCAKAKAAGIPYGYLEQDLIPSEVPQQADSCGFSMDLLGINPDRHFPPRRLIRLSFAPGKAPGRIDGGALATRISSFSAGLARR